MWEYVLACGCLRVLAYVGVDGQFRGKGGVVPSGCWAGRGGFWLDGWLPWGGRDMFQ